MNKIKLKRIKNFEEKKQEEIAMGLYSAYKHIFGKHTEAQIGYWEIYSFFKRDLIKKNTAIALEYDGKILGAIDIEIKGNLLKIQSIFGKPSKKFLKEQKITVANFLMQKAKKTADKKKLRLSYNSLSPTAKKAIGIRKRNPKRKIKIRIK